MSQSGTSGTDVFDAVPETSRDSSTAHNTAQALPNTDEESAPTGNKASK